MVNDMGSPKKELTQADRQAAYAYMNNFKREKYDRFVCERPKGDKAPLAAIAKKKGMSMNEFINMCIDKELKRMKIDLEQMKAEAIAKNEVPAENEKDSPSA